MVKVLFIAIVVLGSSLSLAADGPPATARQYPGGADEQDLKVQPKLVPPAAKLDRRTLDQKVLQSFLRKSGQPATTKSTKK
jgi:hypothetical protein